VKSEYGSIEISFFLSAIINSWKSEVLDQWVTRSLSAVTGEGKYLQSIPHCSKSLIQFPRMCLKHRKSHKKVNPSVLGHEMFACQSKVTTLTVVTTMLCRQQYFQSTCSAAALLWLPHSLAWHRNKHTSRENSESHGLLVTPKTHMGNPNPMWWYLEVGSLRGDRSWGRTLVNGINLAVRRDQRDQSSFLLSEYTESHWLMSLAPTTLTSCSRIFWLQDGGKCLLLESWSMVTCRSWKEDPG
jgi:hypothetical protein